MADEIKLEPTQAAAVFEDSHNDLKGFLDAVKDLGETGNSVQRVVYSDPINEALVQIGNVLNDIGDGVNQGVGSYHTAFSDVAKAWKDSDFKSGSIREFTALSWDAVTIDRLQAEKLEVSPAQIDRFIEQIQSQYSVMKTRFDNIHSNIRSSTGWYTGEGADITRGTFESKVVPLMDEVTKAKDKLIQALEAEKAELLRKSANRYVQ